MIYMPPQAKFTQTTAQLKRRRKGKKKKKKRVIQKKRYTHTHTCIHTHIPKNLVLVDEGETFCKEKKKTQHNISFKSRLGKGMEGGRRKEVVNIITSALRFIWNVSRTKELWRGKQDVLAANITVKFQFYLRESSFIKSHDWNCVTGANILHPDRCVSLRMPFSCQRSLDGVAPITICLSSS